MRSGLVMVVAMMVGGMAVPVGAQERQVDEGGRVASDVSVEIDSVAGSITVRAWDRNEIQVRGSLGEGTDTLRFENDGDSAEIRVERRRRRRNPVAEISGSHLDIMLPAGASLEIDTLAATVVIDGVHGEIKVDTSAGDITYAGASLEVDLFAASGAVEVRSSASGAQIDVEAVAGSVVVEFESADISASTLTGNLRVLGGTLGEGDFESVSGSLYYEGAIGGGAEVSFENFDGDIELLIPADTSAAFDISSYSGSIDTEFGYEGSLVEAYSSEVEANFTLGAGNAEVDIETFAGRVDVRRR